MLIRLLATLLTSSAAISFMVAMLGVRLARSRPTPVGYRRIRLGAFQIEIPPTARRASPFDVPAPGGSG